MIISIVVAAATNNAIGKEGKLLWHLPADLRFFKNTTWAMPVIMGRKTYTSMNKALPGRLNIVITRNNDWTAEGVLTAPDLDTAIQMAEDRHYKEAFVIGGGEIYKHALPLTDKVYLTRVEVSLEGDAFFPELDLAVWQMVSDDAVAADDKHAYPFHFQLWKRKKANA